MFMGEYLKIVGGRPLFGRVRVPAAKNSVLPLMAAAMMCQGETVLQQVPDLADVRQSMAIYEALGGRCSWQGSRLRLKFTAQQGEGVLPQGPARAMRSSVFYLAPALHRFGRVQTVQPGGCNLGPRPIDIHLEGLARMGAQIEWQGETLVITAPRGLRGTEFVLRLPSVGATETLLMAAVLAKGETVLRGAAREPEVVDLANYLTACGAWIQGAGSSVIRIRGTAQLEGCSYQPIPDRITAATLAAGVASAGGHITLEGCPADLLEPTLCILQQAGCGVRRKEEGVQVERSGSLKGVGRLYTGVYPGFSTDAAPVVAAALLTAKGQSSIEDTIFENRFACGEEFCKLGAKAWRDGRRLELVGVPALTGAPMQAADLRGGAALVVAALAAQGESRVFGLEHIRRGYKDLPGTLQALGANITLCTLSEQEEQDQL